MSYDRGVWAAALLMLLPACDVVFGLDRAPADAANDEALPAAVTGRFTLRYVTNQADATPTVVEQKHPDVALQVVVADALEGSALPLDDDGRFSFERPAGAPYRLLWQSALDGNVATEWSTDAASVAIASHAATRPARVPVTQPTLLAFPTPAFVGQRVVHSTGIWTETGIMGDTMDWQNAFALSPPLALLDQARFDRLYYVVRQTFIDGASALQYQAFGAEASTQITMQDGAAHTVPLTFVASTRDQCAKIVALRGAMMARVGVAAQAATAVAGDDWLIQAAPSMVLGPVGALTVAYHTEATATNATLTVMYRNPFPGHEPVASMGGFHKRTILAPGAATGLDLLIGVRIYAPVTPCPAMTVLDSTQGIPGVITLADSALTGNDGAVVVLPANQPATLSWRLAVDGRVDLTSVKIFEVTADAGKTVLVPLRTYFTVGTSIVIDPALLQPRGRYIVRIDSNIGHVNARTGDLRTVAYPYGNATQWSRVFGVDFQ